MNWVLRIISMAGALLLIDSRLMTDLIGIAILAVILVLQKATAKNKKTDCCFFTFCFEIFQE